jgi:hypothetical protein
MNKDLGKKKRSEHTKEEKDGKTHVSTYSDEHP